MLLKIDQTEFTKVSEITIPDIFYNRLLTNVKEFDSMFGNGILPGSSFTVTAQAGCGKTTLLLQLMNALALNGYNVGYSSGEENKFQLAFTCNRLNVKQLSIATETDIDKLAAAMKDLDAIVIDSFQALTSTKKMNSSELERYAVTTLIDAAKTHECALFFVMHLTKLGQLKGSSLVPHAVDVNVQIMRDPDGEEEARIISTYKNRFGPCLDYEATMTSHGFELSGMVKTVQTGVASTKAARKRDLSSKILELDPPNITKSFIMQELNLTSSQAYFALRELTESGKLVKYGRGDEAVWKKVLTAEAVK